MNRQKAVAALELATKKNQDRTGWWCGPSLEQTALVESLLDRLDVYKLALAMACGDHELCGAKLSHTEIDAQQLLETAQDELRHGRGPDWLTEDHDENTEETR